MPGLQAVVIATPTHWHALQFIAACEKGLHVFLEKPISYDIREGQAMLDVNAQVKEYIESGDDGKIHEVKANRPAPMQKYMCTEKGGKPRWRDQFAFSRGVMVYWAH